MIFCLLMRESRKLSQFSDTSFKTNVTDNSQCSFEINITNNVQCNVKIYATSSY